LSCAKAVMFDVILAVATDAKTMIGNTSFFNISFSF
jgi:hypothetical protein